MLARDTYETRDKEWTNKADDLLDDQKIFLEVSLYRCIGGFAEGGALAEKCRQHEKDRN